MTPRRTPSKLYRPLSGTRRLVSQLKKEPNELKKKMLLVGYVTSSLERGSESVYLVGGQAVETYTAGQFTTGDIDITTTDRGTTEEVLKQVGFKKKGMIWLNETVGLAVHIVDSYLKRTEKTRTFQIGSYTVRVVGIEDLIIDRLSASKFWKSQRDSEQANALFKSFRAQIDLQYLRERAKQERVDDILPS